MLTYFMSWGLKQVIISRGLDKSLAENIQSVIDLFEKLS